MILSVILIISAFLLLASLIFGTIESTVIICFINFIVVYFVLREQNKYKKANSFQRLSGNHNCVHTKLDCENCFLQSSCTSQDENLVQNPGGE